MVEELALDRDSLVIEIGSNDGYLLQHFKDRGIRVIGIEPTQTGTVAMSKGIHTLPVFFDRQWAEIIGKSYGKADLIVCNNVLAHVPDINGFCLGIKHLLKDGFNPDKGRGGVATFEFPSLRKLIEGQQWDTVYHEHYSYLSFRTARDILRSVGIHVHDVEHIPTHGGSLRVFANNYGRHVMQQSVIDEVVNETDAGMRSAPFYEQLQDRVDEAADRLRAFLEDAHDRKLHVCGFGAAAKGNTLLNYAGIDERLLPYIVDDTPAKQGKFAPGSRIPIVADFDGQPDCILLLAWNWLPQAKVRLAKQIAAGSLLVTAIPKLQVH
jgi:SAM-dependent methyltransferase